MIFLLSLSKVKIFDRTQYFTIFKLYSFAILSKLLLLTIGVHLLKQIKIDFSKSIASNTYGMLNTLWSSNIHSPNLVLFLAVPITLIFYSKYQQIKKELLKNINTKIEKLTLKHLGQYLVHRNFSCQFYVRNQYEDLKRDVGKFIESTTELSAELIAGILLFLGYIMVSDNKIKSTTTLFGYLLLVLLFNFIIYTPELKEKEEMAKNISDMRYFHQPNITKIKRHTELKSWNYDLSCLFWSIMIVMWYPNLIGKTIRIPLLLLLLLRQRDVLQILPKQFILFNKINNFQFPVFSLGDKNMEVINEEAASLPLSTLLKMLYPNVGDYNQYIYDLNISYQNPNLILAYPWSSFSQENRKKILGVK